MTIDLPEDLLAALRARVLGGHFASLDDAVAESVRLMLGYPVREENRQIVGQPGMGSIGTHAYEIGHDPVLGSMRDDADAVDEMVAYTMRRRRADACRDVDISVE